MKDIPPSTREMRKFYIVAFLWSTIVLLYLNSAYKHAMFSFFYDKDSERIFWEENTNIQKAEKIINQLGNSYNKDISSSSSQNPNLCIGIPSIHRIRRYTIITVGSVLEGLEEEEEKRRNEVVILLYNAMTPPYMHPDAEMLSKRNITPYFKVIYKPDRKPVDIWRTNENFDYMHAFQQMINFMIRIKNSFCFNWRVKIADSSRECCEDILSSNTNKSNQSKQNTKYE